jgi:hypothetical protein
VATTALERAQLVLAHDRQESLAFVQAAGEKRTLALLQASAKDLQARLTQAEGLSGPGKGSFTAAQLRATLAQVRAVLKPLQQGIKGVLLDQAPEAAAKGAEHTANYLVAADKAFRGVGQQPLALRTALMMEAAGKGSVSSILRRLASDPEHPARMGILQRYGVETIGHFEREMQKGILGKKSWEEMRQDITKESPFLQGAPAFWGRRIVRTEAHAALGRGAHEALVKVNDDLGGFAKILSCVFDDRIGADSVAVHGQIRRPEEPFESWNGDFMYPPDRPNDRAVSTPHRIQWPIPPYLAWQDEDAIADAWERDGRKGAPPERPLMTTIPLEQFGQVPDEATSASSPQSESASNEDHGEPEVPDREPTEAQAAAEDAPWYDPGIPEIPDRGPKETQAPVEEAEFEKKPEVIPEPEPELEKELTSAEILATKDADAKGSNEGGFYTGADDVQRYVKFYDDPSQAFCEHLSNQVYRDLDLKAPDSLTFDHDGKEAYASNVVDGLKTVQQSGLTAVVAKKVMKGFAADVLLGNWDAVGLGLDNVGVVGDDVMRVDNGGSLLFRAKAGRKPEEVLNTITEWDGFFGSKNPYYSEVANKAGYEKATDLGKDLIGQIGKIAKLEKTAGGWKKYVEEHAGDMKPADKARVVGMLAARTKLLKAKVAEIKEAISTTKLDAAKKRLEAREQAKKEKEYAKIAKKLGGPAPQKYEELKVDDKRTENHIHAKHLYGAASEAAYGQMAKDAIKDAYPHRDGVVQFTGNQSELIRAYERNPKKPAGESTRRYAADIEQFMAKAKPMPPGIMYRGLKDLDAKHLNRLLTEPTFGFNCTSSCSRKGEVSWGTFASGGYSKGSVLLVIKQKTAVPVETISTHDHELELLAKKGSAYRITERYRHKNAVIIECEEVTGKEAEKVWAAHEVVRLERKKSAGR